MALKIDTVPDCARIYYGAKIPFGFGIDSNGNYGYIKRGADTVTPFKSVECKTGSGTYSNDGYAQNTYTINFPSAFSKIPTVYAFREGYIPHISDRTACNPNLIGISSVTTTSFVLTLYNSSRDGAYVNVRWCAVV